MRAKETEIIQLKKEKENAKSMQRKLEATNIAKERAQNSTVMAVDEL